MQYSKIEMAELAVAQISVATEVIDDPELEELARQVFQKVIDIYPDSTTEQMQALQRFSRDIARKQLEAERKTGQLEQEKMDLQKQSDRDLYNPEIYSDHGWYRVMRDVLAGLRRNNQTAIIMSLDLDNFKLYNDTRGHVEGDNALGLTGHLIKSVLRPTDIVARLHGDEYTVVLPGANIEAGVVAASRIQQSVSQLSGLLETTIPFSISIGVAELGKEVISTEYGSDEQLVATLKQSYALADRALYGGAKTNGKKGIGVIFSDGKIQTAFIREGTETQPSTINYIS